MPRTKDYAGQRFGTFTALYATGDTSKSGSRIWLFRCECGAERVAPISYIKVSLKKNLGVRLRCDGCNPRKLSPEARGLSYIMSNYKSRAKRRHLVWELDKDQIREIVKSDCFYCGTPPSNLWTSGRFGSHFVYNGIDRVNNKIGYTLSNCVPCCSICNTAKNNLEQDEFLSWIKRIQSRGKIRF